MRVSRRPVRCPLLPANPGETSPPEMGLDHVCEAYFSCLSGLGDSYCAEQILASGGHFAGICGASATSSARKKCLRSGVGRRVYGLSQACILHVPFPPVRATREGSHIHRWVSMPGASRPVLLGCLLPHHETAKRMAACTFRVQRTECVLRSDH